MFRGVVQSPSRDQSFELDISDVPFVLIVYRMRSRLKILGLNFGKRYLSHFLHLLHRLISRHPTCFVSHI